MWEGSQLPGKNVEWSTGAKTEINLSILNVFRPALYYLSLKPNLNIYSQVTNLVQVILNFHLILTLSNIQNFCSRRF